MDHQQQQRINEAAEQFTDALAQSYRAVAERGASTQEHNRRLTEDFFKKVVDNLRAQAEENRQATELLTEQHQRQADAAQTITQESVGAYMHFIDSMFVYWQDALETAKDRDESGAGVGAIGASRSTDVELPLENYDSLSANEINDRIKPLSVEEIERLREYEARNKNRRTVLERMDARIGDAS
jgi:hypothetical protein